MTYVKIGPTLYPATVSGRQRDLDWDYRESREIKCQLTYQQAMAVFVDDVPWSIVYQEEARVDPETGEMVTPEPVEYDNSDFCVAGPVTDLRDGYVKIKMGKLTAEEALAIITGEGT